MRVTRRDLGRMLAGDAPAAAPMPAEATSAREAAPMRPRSADVEIGLTVPDSFGRPDLSARDVLARCVTLGVRAIEIGSASIEAILGAPPEPDALRLPDVTFEHGVRPGEEAIYEEPIAIARRRFAAEMRAWRASASLAPLDALRREYDEAGVRIDVVRWDDLACLADEEIEHACRVARALGAGAIATAFSSSGPARMGAFAAHHRLFVGFHGDQRVGAADFEAAFACGAFVGANVDLGDWLIGGHGSPVPFLARYADRVTHVHLKDARTSDGAITWFGQGDAPVRDVLLAMRDHRWPFPAMIEIAYDLSTEADQMAEIARAITYCRAT